MRYHFVVQPPRAPAGAKSDPIVKQWYELDQRFDDRCKRLATQLANVEQHESSLGKAFARLRAALLGHGAVRGQLGIQLARLADSQPSACDPDGALALLDELTSVEQAAAALAKDLKEDERKAREQKEREQQEEEFQQRQKKAHRELGRDEAEKEARLAREERRRIEEERRRVIEAQRLSIQEKAHKLGYRVKETREGDKLRMVLVKRVY